MFLRFTFAKLCMQAAAMYAKSITTSTFARIVYISAELLLRYNARWLSNISLGFGSLHSGNYSSHKIRFHFPVPSGTIWKK